MTNTSFAVRDVPALFKTMVFAIILAAAWGASTTIYAFNGNSWKLVSGSGHIKSESRAVPGFSGIALALPGLVEIQQGNREGVTIETDDNLLPLIETVVENGTLMIRLADRNTSFKTRKLKFTVFLKTIDRLDIAGSGDIRAESLKASALKASIAGSGDIRINSLDADALRVTIAGSGDFVAAGHARSLHASITGSGDVDAENLETKTAEVGIDGSGDTTVWTRETLHIRVVGSGDVSYYGDPQVTKSISGSGEIKRLGAAPAGP